ncbi:conserved hypothetical protein [Rippkaea orientalis PCC 8801]|uniref:Uncharacterized protein n=1 Tax=Rippkaea orientalis (strain PCC 8801 / RF-1) TaxID=41431 RepID=B7JXH6_RIPO1|nr:hypothetical protein [Rippkaea orientalis]ACK64733.1 conserved hypothetical protein [Rippkaea orientalis PCC 8801]
MSYRQLNLADLKYNFNLTFIEDLGIFNNAPRLKPSQLLLDILEDNIGLAVAIGTEKARSELIIAPILVFLLKHFDNKISLFSGVEFNVNLCQGLTGVCDFILSLSPEQLFVQAPIITLIEAKNDNLKLGLPHCLGEMLGAQFFNQKVNNNIQTIYGVVTTGTSWQFLSLNNQTVKIDLEEYSLTNLPKILGILASFIPKTPDNLV